MKKFLLISTLFLFGCDDTVPVTDENNNSVWMNVKKVKVDGVFYYASESKAGYWVLGPRVPENKGVEQ